ncbi:polyadenylate-binding protein 2-like [Toxorhynchites rutilus septentrionalis]|uniref:polyadenylate-binding protein 2-like n=1 Tax=Toxorhynchites rutilus septentrionalis TaxID=329112 RepID=UPI00247A1151|nr:polyadenylate-binding protein 2-like [Toxorhynchites rutilus septentrionalis]XP_055642923.1 polyadenylate-binding protein 2-like [Toxorhynchites rutilus septentrionalis]
MANEDLLDYSYESNASSTDSSKQAKEDDTIKAPNDDPKLEARAKEIAEELEKLKQLQDEIALQMMLPVSKSTSPILTPEEKAEVDARSIYVGNVDYGATAEELETHFYGCGVIYRVNIMCNKANGQPKGFAYIEFGSKEFVETALVLNETLFRGRPIKVCPKRTNLPGMCATNRLFPRGSRGRRGSGMTWGACYHGSQPGATRHPHRGGYRGRTAFYAPY